MNPLVTRHSSLVTACAAALATLAASALDFSEVAAVTIPEGAVESISTLDGEVLWKRLPYDAEVDYLESTGTQYVDTGWHPSSNSIRMKLRAESRGAPVGTALSGAELRDISARWVFVLFGQSADSSKVFPLVGDWNNKNSGFTFVSGTVIDIDWSATATGTTIKDSESGVQFSHAFGSVVDFRQNTTSLSLFQNATTQRAKIRLAYCRLYDNGVLVRDFVPVRKDGEGCLYDRVSGQLYRNQGTGAFAVGPDKTNAEE